MNVMIYNLFLWEITINPGLWSSSAMLPMEMLYVIFLFQLIFVFPMFQFTHPKTKEKQKLS